MSRAYHSLRGLQGEKHGVRMPASFRHVFLVFIAHTPASEMIKYLRVLVNAVEFVVSEAECGTRATAGV